MRVYLFLAVLAFIHLASCNQRTGSNTNKQDDIEEPVSTFNKEEADSLKNTIYAFIKAFENKSNAEINALIHPELGIKIIYRPGVSDTFFEAKAIDFSKPIPSYYEYLTITSDYALEYGQLPEYDCATETWDKLGLYCDTTIHPNILSSIIAFENQYAVEKFSKAYIDNILESESNSYRVILAKDDPFVFHVQHYEGRWYVVVLDRAYAGCDA